MKKIISIFLIISLMSPTSIQLGMLLYFQLNKDFISATLCENRYTVSKKCEGKCFIVKKIKQTQENSQKAPTTKNKVQLPTLCCDIQSLQISLPPTQAIAVQYSISKTSTDFSAYLQKIKKPPQVLAA